MISLVVWERCVDRIWWQLLLRQRAVSAPKRVRFRRHRFCFLRVWKRTRSNFLLIVNVVTDGWTCREKIKWFGVTLLFSFVLPLLGVWYGRSYIAWPWASRHSRKSHIWQISAASKGRFFTSKKAAGPKIGQVWNLNWTREWINTGCLCACVVAVTEL